MRYFGKDGLQCRPVVRGQGGPAYTCRLVARSVLFGRVPRRMVLWLGMGVMAATITLGLWGTLSLDPSDSVRHHSRTGVFLLQR